MRVHVGICLGLALSAGVGLGCATPRPARVEMPEAEIRGILLSIESFRGLKEDTLPLVVMLSPDEFLKAYTEFMRRDCRESKKFLESRHLDPASRDMPEDCDKLEARKPRKYANTLAGFYDEGRRSVTLLDFAALIESWGWPVDEKELKEHRANTLSHELQHFLQHQNFDDVWREAELLVDDESRSFRALREGDASLVGTIYTAQAMGYDWKFRLEKMLHQSQTSSFQGNSYEHVQTPFVGGDQNIERALTFGAYTAGMAFVVELYSRGGFAMVDRAYQHPPRSTEQILHPDKYLAGELPVEVPAHVLPAGMEVKESTRDGELYLRAILSTCTGWLHACEMATGWAGDRWTWMKEDGKIKALVWTQIWDREEDARKFFQPPDVKNQCLRDVLEQSLVRAIELEEKKAKEQAKEQVKEQVKEQAKDTDKDQAKVDPPKPVVIARIRGRKTGFAVGLPPEQAEPVLEAFFDAPIVDPPPAPPPP